MSAEAAASYEPPHERPAKDADPTEWINWRVFSIETLSNFLNHSAAVAKEVAPAIESLTCFTAAPLRDTNAKEGVNYYDNAKSMDTLGITHYLPCYGGSYFHAAQVLDNAECAAALNGKHSWIIEYDARTNITLKKLYQETYAAIGAGIKGIMYYQWRGDHVFPDSPEGNGFGFINYDGTPTEHYEEKLDVVRLLNKLSDVIVNAEKVRCGAAVLYSRHAFVAADAIDNGAQVTRNTWLDLYKLLYKSMRQEGITVDLVESDTLAANPLNIKVLLVPGYDLLSDAEKADVQAFAENGGKVYTCATPALELYELGQTPVKYEGSNVNILDALEANGIEPIIHSSDRSLMVQVIAGEGCALACLNNISAARPVMRGVTLTLNKISATTATLYTPYSEQELKVEGNTIVLPEIKEGAFVLLK